MSSKIVVCYIVPPIASCSAVCPLEPASAFVPRVLGALAMLSNIFSRTKHEVEIHVKKL